MNTIRVIALAVTLALGWQAYGATQALAARMAQAQGAR